MGWFGSVQTWAVVVCISLVFASGRVIGGYFPLHVVHELVTKPQAISAEDELQEVDDGDPITNLEGDWGGGGGGAVVILGLSRSQRKQKYATVVSPDAALWKSIAFLSA